MTDFYNGVAVTGSYGNYSSVIIKTGKKVLSKKSFDRIIDPAKTISSGYFFVEKDIDTWLYTKATHVHHVQYVRKHPSQGVVYSNLIPLCHDCHEEVHGHRQKEKKEPLTVERW